jgi:hypothetical protein
MAKPTLVNFHRLQKVWSEDKNVIAEVITITPADATSWLKGNNNNRPVRRSHVDFLAREMLEGNWQVNGQAIIIAEDEKVLDGQHRLLAIIESGVTIQSLVVYGITEDAFKTIDTGVVRTGSDALHMHFKEAPSYALKAVGTAVRFCLYLENTTWQKRRIGNTDVIAYVKKHQSLIVHAERLQSYPHDARPLGLGVGTALYEMFARKHEEQADTFMRNLYTGEDLARTDPEYLLRAAFIRDANRAAKLPTEIRLKMVIKGWNWRRRGNTEATRTVIYVGANDDPKVKIY